jgi:hypothetical protein
MKIPTRYPARFFIAMLGAAAMAMAPARLPAAEQKTEIKQLAFATPEEAIKALVDATKSADHAALRDIFGPEGKTLVTGDRVQDAAAFELFCKEVGKMCVPVSQGDNKVILNIGDENWPFPIPLVKKEGQWFFDTAAGKEEVINRHIGADELNTIGVCHAYVEAQRQYAAKDRDGNEVLKYAQKFKSAPGKKDGLYWDSATDEEQSPFGPLVAEAREEGYTPRKAGEGPHPFHGYIFRILTRQGAAAPGGKYSYTINGNMIAGFAMIAWPANWGKSGIMTFIINQQGKVYQRNFGPKAAQLAAAITEYNPDKGWTLVLDQQTAVK